MGKHLSSSDITPPIISNNNNGTFINYFGIIIGLLSLIICYLLYKKIQNLDLENSSFNKIEQQFTKFIKEQNQINNEQLTKFNILASQLNEVKNEKETFLSENLVKKENSSIKLQEVKQPEQREMMPTNIFQTSVPVVNNVSESVNLPPPAVTINKKSEKLNDTTLDLNKINTKKVVNISDNDQIRISEDSSEDEN
jgi:hypothetical protein